MSLCTKDGLTHIEYDESLDGLHAGNLRNEHIFLNVLGLKDVRIEEAVNKAKQEAVECGCIVCHYMEELLGCSAGQPKQSQGWPNSNGFSKLTAHVQRMVESLEAEREKWCKDVEADNVNIETSFLEHGAEQKSH